MFDGRGGVYTDPAFEVITFLFLHVLLWIQEVSLPSVWPTSIKSPLLKRDALKKVIISEREDVVSGIVSFLSRDTYYRHHTLHPLNDRMKPVRVDLCYPLRDGFTTGLYTQNSILNNGLQLR